mmetsp:Transcript_706/g.1631  ORF Transcript_706/g.1631 Transcript_706/m.1631 type:complete len:202 (-) Transcript_706:52-657(-)
MLLLILLTDALLGRHGGPRARRAGEERRQLHEHAHDLRVVLVLHDVVGVGAAVHHRLLDPRVLERRGQLGVAHQLLDGVLRRHAHGGELRLHLRRVHVRHPLALHAAHPAVLHLRHDGPQLVLVHGVVQQHLEGRGVPHHLRQVRVHQLLHLRVAQHVLHVLELGLLPLRRHGLPVHEGVGAPRGGRPRRLRRAVRVLERE